MKDSRTAVRLAAYPNATKPPTAGNALRRGSGDFLYLEGSGRRPAPRHVTGAGPQGSQLQTGEDVAPFYVRL